MNDKNKLKSCPFCGGSVSIAITDDEGNPRDEEYEKEPWSGVSYRLRHAVEDNDECPIAHYGEDGGIGVYLYSSRQKAIDKWNERVC